MKLRNEPVKKQPSTTVIREWEPAILQVECQMETITATLSDGRVVSIPKAWYQPLREASTKQLTKYEILPRGKGIYFSTIDEYLPVTVFTHGLNSSCC